MRVRYPAASSGPLARLRTDLDRFTSDEAELLAYHGYWSAHARFGALFPDMAVKRPMWRDYEGMTNAETSDLVLELRRPRHRWGTGARLR